MSAMMLSHRVFSSLSNRSALTMVSVETANVIPIGWIGIVFAPREIDS